MQNIQAVLWNAHCSIPPRRQAKRPAAGAVVRQELIQAKRIKGKVIAELHIGDDIVDCLSLAAQARVVRTHDAQQFQPLGAGVVGIVDIDWPAAVAGLGDSAAVCPAEAPAVNRDLSGRMVCSEEVAP